jgi:uncharacterized protein
MLDRPGGHLWVQGCRFGLALQCSQRSQFHPRAIDPERSKPWRPWHPLTRSTQQPVEPGKIEEYKIEILSTGNLFKAGHRICLDITSLDLPSGLAGAHDVEYAPYHICSSKTVVHKIYHDEQHPSHLVLPIIPT